jgi:hypothetical protein
MPAGERALLRGSGFGGLSHAPAPTRASGLL